MDCCPYFVINLMISMKVLAVLAAVSAGCLLAQAKEEFDCSLVLTSPSEESLREKVSEFLGRVSDWKEQRIDEE